MKIISFFHGIRQKDFIVLKPVDKNDWFIINKLFANKADREKRTQQEVLLRCEINAPYQHRTFKQNNAVWVIVGIIFQSLENRNGTHEELYKNCPVYKEICDTQMEAEAREEAGA